MNEIADILQIKRVANGWIVSPGPLTDREFVHVYVRPTELAEHVKCWAEAQLSQTPQTPET